MALAMALAGVPVAADSQVSSSDAALFLVIPVGARATGQGHTLVAEDSAGSEAIWWNAAGIARQRSREAAIHHSQTVAGTGDAISFVIPTRARGVFAASVNILDLGTQQVTEDPNQPPVGLILVRNVIYAATYAIAPGRSFSAGANYKFSQLRVDCTGQCGELPPRAETIRAVDAGVQYRVGGSGPVLLGAAYRNQQADRRARQAEVGVSYDVRALEEYVSDVRLRIALAALDRVFERRASAPADPPPDGQLPPPSFFHDIDLRMGATILYQDRVNLRAGYITGGGDASGPALGFGVVAGRLSFDIARAFDGLSADAGEPPTYFSLRFVF
ncbi:hypothetical protein BH23GEM2_BH23GEM2_22910 [soil metagenome]